MLTRVFGELFYNNRTGWHVDTNSQCFCSEYNLNEAFDEAFFNCFFEHWNHSCVMARNSGSYIVEEIVVLQCLSVIKRERVAMALNNFANG